MGGIYTATWVFQNAVSTDFWKQTHCLNIKDVSPWSIQAQELGEPCRAFDQMWTRDALSLEKNRLAIEQESACRLKRLMLIGCIQQCEELSQKQYPPLLFLVPSPRDLSQWHVLPEWNRAMPPPKNTFEQSSAKHRSYPGKIHCQTTSYLWWSHSYFFNISPQQWFSYWWQSFPGVL